MVILITFPGHPLLHVTWGPGGSGLQVEMDQGAWHRAPKTQRRLWRAQLHTVLCNGEEGGWV